MGGAVTILPLTYLGNIEYFAALCSGDGVVIDIHENYVRQTYRNRCEIMCAGGITPLTVNVAQGRSIRKRPMADTRIDHSKRWRHRHWISLVSAYGNSPYFDHYRGYFEPFFGREFEFLADLNAGLLEKALEALNLKPEYRFSERYVEVAPGDKDLRGSFAPLERDSQTGAVLSPGQDFAPRPYYQVFSERHPFAPNLSIIDLIFCEGPAAAGFLKLP